MPARSRFPIAFLAGFVTYWFTYWVPLALIPLPGSFLTDMLVAFACALFVGRTVYQSGAGVDAGAMAAAMGGALLLGSVSFAAGFFGPMLLAPGANQGPMLGIFITGPLGALAGAVGGAVLWRRRRQETLTPRPGETHGPGSGGVD